MRAIAYSVREGETWKTGWRSGSHGKTCDASLKLSQTTTGLAHGIYERIPEDDIREDFFANRPSKRLPRMAQIPPLILCGDLHADALREKLRACEYEADVTHELVPVKYWRCCAQPAAPAFPLATRFRVDGATARQGLLF